jgi:isocitrate dehydrogenase
MSAFSHSVSRPVALAVAAVLLAATMGLAFAGWLEHAPGIFMALVESGLAWCF